MTEEEIEKVARAIHKAKGYDRWPEPMCTQCEVLARAAITALDQYREGKMVQDLLFGTVISKGGVRIDPKDFFASPPKKEER